MARGFKPEYDGIGEMLNAEWMVEAMRVKAETAKTVAEATAPVDERGPHPGRYKAAFHVDAQARGGLKRDRAEAILSNDAPEAFAVEVGNKNTPAHATLRRAVHHI